MIQAKLLMMLIVVAKTSIGNQIRQTQTVVEEIKRDLNSNLYEGLEDEVDVMCESEVEDYGRGIVSGTISGQI